MSRGERAPARASLKSVAEAAGVSTSSVSNAYNRPDQLSDAVRERILDAARAQGYAGPDAVAASLRSKRAGAIGVLLTLRLSYAFEDPFTVEFLAGLTEVAERFDTGLLLIPFGSVKEASAELAARKAIIDGAIAYAIPLEHPALRVLRERGLPIASTTSTEAGTDMIAAVDELTAAAPLGELLRNLGHRRIAIALAGGEGLDEPGPHTAREVLDVIRGGDGPERIGAILAGLGPDIEPVFVTGGGGNARLGGHRAALAALDLPDPPTAIMGVTDVIALGVLDALRERGLEPGVDVSVTGFDGIPQSAAESLTTIEQPIRERGRLMARMLLDPDFTERHIVLPTRLMIRGSTGRVREMSPTRAGSSS